MCQQFSQTMYILAAGFILSCLLTLPPWPMYRQKPLKWQPAREIVVDEKTGETLLVAPGVAKGTPIKSASVASPSSKGKKKRRCLLPPGHLQGRRYLFRRRQPG